MRRASALLMLCTGVAWGATGAGAATPPDTLRMERAPVAVSAWVLPAGSVQDPPALPGAARVRAEAWAVEAARALADLAAGVGVEVDRTRTHVVLTSSPADHSEARRRVAAVVAGVPSVDVLEEARRRLRARLAFTAHAPVVEFRRASLAQLAPGDEGWASPPEGTLDTLERLNLDALRTWMRDAPSRGQAAVMDVLPGAPTGTTTPGARRPPAPPPSAPAWMEAQRIQVTREVTSTWIAVAYPAPPGAERTMLEFVRHLLEEALTPDPPDPHLISLAVQLLETPGGPVIRVEAAVLPEAAAAWEERTREAVERLRARPPTGAVFTWARRRFRSRTLLADAHPAARAVRAAEDLLRDGRVRTLRSEISALSPDATAGVLRRLGPPRIFVLGPDLSQLR